MNGFHTVCETLHTTNYDPGGFVEYLRVPHLQVDRGIYLLPDEVSFEDGVFIEPLACIVRAQRLARLQLGQTVLILGSGMSGLLHVALARTSGAGRIVATDVNEYRLNAALRFGADAVIRATEDVPIRLRQVNDGRLADLVIICTGAYSAFMQALQSVERGGTVVFFAPTEPGITIPIPVNDFWRNGITVMPSYGAAPFDLAVALELIRARRVPVRDMITHRLSLAEAGLGFRLVAEAKESMKVILEPQR
jgi:L-iditol 2-dehydrogenase